MTIIQDNKFTLLLPGLHKLLLLLSLFCLLALSGSLKAAELWYLGQKIPDVNKIWNSADYRLALKSLKTIDETQPDSLPKRGGSHTGAVFERMVNDENFRPQLDIYQSLDYRREEASRILFSLREMMRLYFDFSAKQQPYGREALSLMKHSLRQQAVLFELTVEFWLTLPEDQQQSPDRLTGLVDTKGAAGLLAKSAIDYLSLHKQFDSSALELYAYELGKNLPELFVHLRDQDRKVLLDKIETQTQNHPLLTIRKALKSVQPVLISIDQQVQSSQRKNA
ncbi:hypothetical protein [Parendozoicomonas sp. Alg238-R29]|uniref:hypothetical protein n=1 Tax=Parendozoicomonas sp. Alg238-R29 TaxID=2993446 RepID=UPI00248E60FA|nr:hypothetical protein [Parendozoicomonas sp. Alg238-R29]